jgi:hypothetical protein
MLCPYRDRFSDEDCPYSAHGSCVFIHDKHEKGPESEFDLDTFRDHYHPQKVRLSFFFFYYPTI